MPSRRSIVIARNCSSGPARPEAAPGARQDRPEKEPGMQVPDLWKPHRGAVSLTFDDALACQLEKAVPEMDKRQIRGTFYLHAGGKGWQERLQPWGPVGRSGHEI